MDNGRHKYDPLLPKDDVMNVIHHESMQLTLHEAVEMVGAIRGLDDGYITHDHTKKERKPRAADPDAEARRQKTNKRRIEFW